MTRAGGITVGYFGVNQAYQLALAAQELGELDAFYCSLYDAPGKWGGVLGLLVGHEALVNRRCAGLDSTRAVEIPGPFLFHRLKAYLSGANRGNSWFNTSQAFDRRLARRLKSSNSCLFVGVETCCAFSLDIARKKGMTTVVDWPGVSTPFLNERAIEAAHQFSLSTAVTADTPIMHSRKKREMELADVILTCSEFHAKTLREQGFPADKLHVVPLWVDTSYWKPANGFPASDSDSLRVLFAGKVDLRKGVPYVVQAASGCNAPVALTLVGGGDSELKPFLKQYDGKIRVLPPCSKIELRKHYHEHDLLVLPSLGDSFGFVAMEAMACGLPVIVTENCGVPVPDPSWRVPVMDSDAIAHRLTLYAQDRNLCREHGLIASEFARQFTPERYREQIKVLYRKLLNLPSTAEPAKDLFSPPEHFDPAGTKEALT